MGLFNKKEIEFIDGREIEIIYDRKLKDQGIEKFISEILTICKKNEMAKMFSKLTFQFEDFLEKNGIDEFAFLHSSDYLNGKYVIYLNSVFFLAKSWLQNFLKLLIMN